MENINNKVYITGEIVSDFQYSHQTYGEKFYLFNVSATRTSGYEDVIPVIVSERLLNTKQYYVGQCISIEGQFRSYNRHEEVGSRLLLTVFAKDCELIDADIIGDSSNQIELCGYICKEPSYRKTPLGREIADIMLAVNRPYGKSDYIPCICWGRDARFVADFTVGGHIQIQGRIQSREYVKKISKDEKEKRIAYEVSVSKLEVIEDED